MGWKIVPTAKTHVCDRPYYVGEGVKTYDIIECDCGMQWQCVGVEYGMQWDPFPRGVLTWRKL